MSWLAIAAIIAIGVFAIIVRSAGRSGWNRRSDRLEAAFFRARGQRLTANGIRANRF
jgi:hypothetical protein